MTERFERFDIPVFWKDDVEANGGKIVDAFIWWRPGDVISVLIADEPNLPCGGFERHASVFATGNGIPRQVSIDELRHVVVDLKLDGKLRFERSGHFVHIYQQLSNPALPASSAND